MRYRMETAAKWVGLITSPDGSLRDQPHGGPSPYFYREFQVEGPVARAEAQVAALGVFHALLNGEAMGQDFLSPGWVEYSRRIPVLRYDLTGRLKPGANAVGVILGDGWYAGRIAIYGRGLYGGYPLALWLRLTITYADGRIQTLGSDESWLAGTGAVLWADLLTGEYRDARLEPAGFGCPGFRAEGWRAPQVLEDRSALLEEARCEPVTLHEKLDAVCLGQVDGRWIYDIGQNMAGILRVRIRGVRGAVLRFRHGEMLREDGSLYTENLRSAQAEDTYICRGGGEEVFQPLFTFHGFRYAEVTIEGEAGILELAGLAAYSDLRPAGEFSCSSALVNRIALNALWGQKSNFLSVPTDCPQRDERMGWTGDTEIFCQSAMYQMDCRRFFRKHLRDILDAVREDGAVTDVAPYVPVVGAGTAAWGDVITVLPWRHYLMYGDAGILREGLPAMKGWIAYLWEHSEDGIRPAEGYGDWLSVGEETDKALLATAWFAYSASITARVCRVLGDGEEDRYSRLYRHLRARFRSVFRSGDGTMRGDTQCAYLLAAAFGLAEPEEIRAPLLRAVHRRGNHLSTGFVGVKFLLPVLCDLGETDLAYELITKTSYPSWGYSVVNGATTIWERWNSYTKEDGFGDVGMNSFNHYSLGSCVEWLYGYVLGIRPSEEAPGFQAPVLRPCVDFSGRITGAQGAYTGTAGRIEVSWKVRDGVCTYEARFPEGMPLRAEPQGGQILTAEQSPGRLCLRFRRKSVEPR